MVISPIQHKICAYAEPISRHILQIPQKNTNASFSSMGPSLGFETLLNPRIRFGASLSYHTGNLDIIPEGNITSSQRFSYSSYWLTGKILYRWSNGFALGPQFVYGQNSIKDLENQTSFGNFLNLDYELVKNLVLSQSFGTLGDSELLAYVLKLEWQF